MKQTTGMWSGMKLQQSEEYYLYYLEVITNNINYKISKDENK